MKNPAWEIKKQPAERSKRAYHSMFLHKMHVDEIVTQPHVNWYAILQSRETFIKWDERPIDNSGERFRCWESWNPEPELWNPEYSLRNPESPLTIRIRNPFPLTKIRNPVPGIRIQRPGIQSPRLLIKKRKLSLWWSFRWSLWCWSVFWPDGLKRWREHAAYCQPNFPGVHP